ncbi:MAG: hemerythrin [Deltaproteobacteria bacterium GWC2_56_8]|nr:MAG: hemerythrin [Deltaproteobacteria bacterium GWB2_55_19]OGP38891.1 MAG: hemerythrin [Deltaproteobacteria bacterium GWC2_56_8]HAO94376.1 hemerythrin [Deltaproteobacteria bacterium]
MALFTWSEEYSVNVASFNGHHRKLMELINDLHDSMKRGKGPDAVGVVLKSLIEYTRVHFSAEQYLMITHGYPGFEAHRAEHDALVRKVEELTDQHARGIAVTVEVFQFLKDWLTTHIKETDRRYSSFFNSKGIS